jgi:twitching motility two-component system response regulator PilG
MPGVDGLELCRTVRSLPQFHELPIIMVTARDGVFDKVQGRLAGATEYLTKPFDSERLRQVVGNFLSVNTSDEVKDKV